MNEVIYHKNIVTILYSHLNYQLGIFRCHIYNQFYIKGSYKLERCNSLFKTYLKLYYQ
jgi:hypothetical protein